MVTEIRASANAEAQLIGADLPYVPDEIPIVHFRDALRLVGAHPDEPDLAPEHERHLGRWTHEEFGYDYVAVEGYPATRRPFYTYPQPDNPRWTNSFDWPGFIGYACALTHHGLIAVTVDHRLYDTAAYPIAAADVRAAVEDTRALEGVDAQRVALWFFLAVGCWSPSGWLTPHRGYVVLP